MSLYGISDSMEKLKGKVLLKAELVGGDLVLTTDDGETRLGVEGDCCSRSWIMDVSIGDYPPADGVILSGEWEDSDLTATDEHTHHVHLQIYMTKFKANGTALVVLWANSSNGYYGGYWVSR